MAELQKSKAQPIKPRKTPSVKWCWMPLGLLKIMEIPLATENRKQEDQKGNISKEWCIKFALLANLFDFIRYIRIIRGELEGD